MLMTLGTAFISFTPTFVQCESAERLADEGFLVSNTYGDGVIRMERPMPNGDTLYTFVNGDGSFRPPRVWEIEIERIAERMGM